VNVVNAGSRNTGWGVNENDVGDKIGQLSFTSTMMIWQEEKKTKLSCIPPKVIKPFRHLTIHSIIIRDFLNNTYNIEDERKHMRNITSDIQRPSERFTT
jgi:hypothetical protein